LAVTTDLMTGWPSFPAAPAFVAKALEYWFARFKPGDDGQGLPSAGGDLFRRRRIRTRCRQG
jgi:hypothetical protein